MVNDIMNLKNLFLGKLSRKIWKKSKLTVYFSRWRVNTIKGEMEELMEEFENINIILTERAFKDNMFRTKCHVEHMNADKKIEQLTRLLNTHDVRWNEENIDSYTQGNIQSVQNSNIRDRIFQTNYNDSGNNHHGGNNHHTSFNNDASNNHHCGNNHQGSPVLRTEGMNTNFGQGSSFKKKSNGKENTGWGFT
jgi:hypothetical protein